MTNKRWKEISQFVEIGDPLKDIGCDEQELYEYCVELRNKLAKAKRLAVLSPIVESLKKD